MTVNYLPVESNTTNKRTDGSAVQQTKIVGTPEVPAKLLNWEGNADLGFCSCVG